MNLKTDGEAGIVQLRERVSSQDTIAVNPPAYDLNPTELQRRGSPECEGWQQSEIALNRGSG